MGSQTRDVINLGTVIQTGKMAATGVLPFVRGIDLTKNDFEVGNKTRGTGFN